MGRQREVEAAGLAHRVLGDVEDELGLVGAGVQVSDERAVGQDGQGDAVRVAGGRLVAAPRVEREGRGRGVAGPDAERDDFAGAVAEGDGAPS